MKLRLTAWYQHPKIYKASESPVVPQVGADTSWASGSESITLQEVEELIKDVKAFPLVDIEIAKIPKPLGWKDETGQMNSEEAKKIKKVEVSKKFPIWLVVDGANNVKCILDGNHRLHKAINAGEKTIWAKLINPLKLGKSKLADKARSILFPTIDA